ncbi:MAG: zinc-dependent metalloprotease, partial [Planctomycetota bacterium]
MVAAFLVGLAASCFSVSTARADAADDADTAAGDTAAGDTTTNEAEPDAKSGAADTVKAESGSASKSSASTASSKSAPKPKYPPFATVTKDTKKIDGLITLYQGDTKLFAELKPSDLDKDLIVLITIARGIGQTPVLGGFSWGFGDDWVWQFRKRGDRIHVVRRNVRFRAERGSPTEKAVKLAYTDSILYSLPIAGKNGGSYLVDLSPIFLSDLPKISMVLPGFTFSKSRSTWADVKGFDENLEIQVAATYASSGRMSIDSVPDTRGATINVHYSISRLPKTSYKPRIADDRVGYFLTVLKDFSKEQQEDKFVRYINRWDLRKADPKADKSPPKEPIVFWLEKTIPYKYRKPIRDGIAEWNKAFEKAGFYDAIDVRQQPDDAEWEPGDIRYNTFRWITAGAGFAMGPSRVNPLTGQILDADIIFDSDFLQYWRTEYETFTPKGIEVLTGGPIDLEGYEAEQSRRPPYARCGAGGRCACNLLGGMSHQLALGATMAAVRQRSVEDEEKLIMQALKEVTMHEVGHTLGLRHNFKASTLYSVDELNDVSKTSKTGVSASVMDYNPANIAPGGVEQGDYYSTTIGPYDYWAIEYGYTPMSDEKTSLDKIASRSGEPGLAYATDEDTRGIDPDPHSYRFDMSDDLVAYAEREAQLVSEAWPKIVESMTDEGDGYSKARQAFGVLLATHGRAMYVASRYIGGVHVSRSHKGDANAPAPFESVSADRQRAAMDLVAQQVFSDEPFLVPSDIYGYLAP